MIGVAVAFTLLLGCAVSGAGGWWLTGLVVDTPERWHQTIEQAAQRRARPSRLSTINQISESVVIGNVVQAGIEASPASYQLTKHKSRYKCSLCSRRIRKSVWSSSWHNPLGSGYNLCDTCIQTQPDRDDWSKWMGMDIVRG